MWALDLHKYEGLMDNMVYDAAGEGLQIRNKIFFVSDQRVCTGCQN